MDSRVPMVLDSPGEQGDDGQRADLAQARSRRRRGVMSRVAMVPRSFSPAMGLRGGGHAAGEQEDHQQHGHHGGHEGAGGVRLGGQVIGAVPGVDVELVGQGGLVPLQQGGHLLVGRGGVHAGGVVVQLHRWGGGAGGDVIAGHLAVKVRGEHRQQVQLLLLNQGLGRLNILGGLDVQPACPARAETEPGRFTAWTAGTKSSSTENWLDRAEPMKVYTAKMSRPGSRNGGQGGALVPEEPGQLLAKNGQHSAFHASSPILST